MSLSLDCHGKFLQKTNPPSSSFKQLRKIIHRLVWATERDEEGPTWPIKKWLICVNCYKLFQWAQSFIQLCFYPILGWDDVMSLSTQLLVFCSVWCPWIYIFLELDTAALLGLASSFAWMSTGNTSVKETSVQLLTMPDFWYLTVSTRGKRFKNLSDNMKALCKF